MSPLAGAFICFAMAMINVPFFPNFLNVLSFWFCGAIGIVLLFVALVS